MFNQTKPDAAMNLPVGGHIDRLTDMILVMRNEADTMQKDLQILRGGITQLSYINKEADQELNSFLVDSIGDLRSRWSSEWDQSHEQLIEHKRRLAKLAEEQEDV